MLVGIFFIYLPCIYLLSQPDTFLFHPPSRDHFLGGGEETRPPLPPGRPGQLYGARDFSFSRGGGWKGLRRRPHSLSLEQWQTCKQTRKARTLEQGGGTQTPYTPESRCFFSQLLLSWFPKGSSNIQMNSVFWLGSSHLC